MQLCKLLSDLFVDELVCTVQLVLCFLGVSTGSLSSIKLCLICSLLCLGVLDDLISEIVQSLLGIVLDLINCLERIPVVVGDLKCAGELLLVDGVGVDGDDALTANAGVDIEDLCCILLRDTAVDHALLQTVSQALIAQCIVCAKGDDNAGCTDSYVAVSNCFQSGLCIPSAVDSIYVLDKVLYVDLSRGIGHYVKCSLELLVPVGLLLEGVQITFNGDLLDGSNVIVRRNTGERLDAEGLAVSIARNRCSGSIGYICEGCEQHCLGQSDRHCNGSSSNSVQK